MAEQVQEQAQLLTTQVANEVVLDEGSEEPEEDEEEEELTAGEVVAAVSLPDPFDVVASAVATLAAVRAILMKNPTHRTPFNSHIFWVFYDVSLKKPEFAILHFAIL